MKRYLIFLLLLLVGWLGLFVPAGAAHANLSQAIPAPNTVLTTAPIELSIWFTEPIEAQFSQLRLFNANGQQVDNQDILVNGNLMRVTLPTLLEGIYTVVWQNVSSVDGHPAEGSYLFSIGRPLPQQTIPPNPQPLVTSWAEPVARAVVLWSGLVVVGGLAFNQLVMNGNVSGRKQLFFLAWLAMALFLLASIGQLWLQVAVVQRLSNAGFWGQAAGNILTKTFWGQLWLVRLAIWLLFALGLAFRPNQPRLAWLGFGLLVPISLTSHAAATAQITEATLFNDLAHLVAAALWVGGLVHFALFLWSGSGRDNHQLLSELVPRFSTLAILSVGTLIITGLYTTWSQLLSLAAWQTPYGVVLLVKLAFLLPLLLLGAYNLLWLSPRLAQQPHPLQLRRSVSGETILATLLIMVVGLLTSLEPARQIAAREGLGQKPISFQDNIEGADVLVKIVPGRVGINQALITLSNRQGQPITDASEVNLTFTYRGQEMPPLSGRATANGEGQYQFDGLSLSLSGVWEMALTIRRPDAFDGQSSFRFMALNPTPQNPTPPRELGLMLWGGELLLLGLLFLGVAAWRGRPQAAWKWLPGLAGVVAGIVLLIIPPAGQEQPTTNPIVADAASLETGRVLFEQKCVACHGPAGLGDGPLAAGLNPPPANLQTHVPLHDDQQLYLFIAGGFPNSAMVGFADQLSSREIWHLVNYLKSLPPANP